MRITNSMMMDNVLRDINSGMVRMSKYNSQLASNRRMVKLSDDPIGVLNSLNARQRIYQINQYQNNIVQARKWVNQSENGVRDMESVIKKIRDAVIDAGGPKTDSDKSNINTLVKQLKQELIDIGNTAIGNQYIYAGFNTTKAPFTMDANGKVLYNGLDLYDTAPQTGAAMTAPAGVTNPVWSGDIYPVNNYTVTAAGDQLTFTGVTGNPVTVTVPAPVAGENTLDLSAYGLGKITYTSDDPPTATAADMATMVAGAGTVTSGLYETITGIKIENALVDPANVTGLTWDGPITNQGKYSMQANGDVLTIVDERGTQVFKGAIDPTTGALDLSGIGLGKITWTDGGGTGADIAQSLADAGFVTTAYGDETSEHIRFEIGFQMLVDGTFAGTDIVGLGSDNMFKILDDLITDLDAGAGTDVLTGYLEKLDMVQDRLLKCAVQTGARTNKLDMMENRYSLDNISAEEVRSSIEDIDQAYTIMQYKFMAAIYEQALAAGAKIIQPTLMDFLR